MPTRKTDLPTLEPDPSSLSRRWRSTSGRFGDSGGGGRPGAPRGMEPDQARRRARRDQAARVLATLNLMFRLGKPPKEPLVGPYDGILVSPSLRRPADRALSLLTSAWMPWVGKRFDADAQQGDNLLRPSARLPARALWPATGPRRAPPDCSRRFGSAPTPRRGWSIPTARR